MKIRRLLIALTLAFAMVIGSITVITPDEVNAASKKGVTCKGMGGAKVSTSSITYADSVALAKGFGTTGYIKITANACGCLFLSPKNASEIGASMSVYLDSGFKTPAYGAVNGKWDIITKQDADYKHSSSIPMEKGDVVYIKCEWNKNTLTTGKYTIDINAGWVPMDEIIPYVDEDNIRCSSAEYSGVSYIDAVLPQTAHQVVIAWDKGEKDVSELMKAKWDSDDKVYGQSSASRDYSSTSPDGDCFDITLSGANHATGDVTVLVMYEYKGLWVAGITWLDLRVGDPNAKDYIVNAPNVKLKGGNVIAGYTKADKTVKIKYNKKTYTVKSNKNGLYICVLNTKLGAGKSIKIWIDGYDFVAKTYTVDSDY